MRALFSRCPPPRLPMPISRRLGSAVVIRLCYDAIALMPPEVRSPDFDLPCISYCWVELLSWEAEDRFRFCPKILDFTEE